MKSKTGIIIGVVIILVVVGAFIFARTAKKQTPPKKQTATTQVSAPAPTAPVNTPNTSAEDPQDVVAGLYKNQIQNTATQEGFVISNSLVENNADKNGKVVFDIVDF